VLLYFTAYCVDAEKRVLLYVLCHSSTGENLHSSADKTITKQRP